MTNTTAYRGSYSLYMGDGSYGRNFEGADGVEAGQSAGGYNLDLFPWMCMAYRIPKGVQANMAILVGTTWYSLTMTGGETPTTPKGGSWGTVFDDDQWHWRCINVRTQLNGFVGTDPYFISAVIFLPADHGNAGSTSRGGFWVINHKN